MYVLTFVLNKTYVSLSVEFIQEILLEQAFTPVPLASEEISGLFSLRGQVITAIDMRKKLNLPERAQTDFANIVIKLGEEQFSLVVDEIGEVIQIEETALEPLPGNMRSRWGQWSDHVFRHDNRLLVQLNLNAILE